jgi:hypothetical protein
MNTRRRRGKMNRVFSLSVICAQEHTSTPLLTRQRICLFPDGDMNHVGFTEVNHDARQITRMVFDTGSAA